MIELQVLGQRALSALGGRDIVSLVPQSKRAALLAYLAVAVPRGAHCRDKLLALFWPESDEVHERAAHNQALYLPRSTLAMIRRSSGGGDVIVLLQ